MKRIFLLSCLANRSLTGQHPHFTMNDASLLLLLLTMTDAVVITTVMRAEIVN